MRDALSIMDQAIASAPCDDGRPVLSALQIRELMGSVPNAIFERLLDAVSAGQSADLMEQLNVLLNAGHSPFSLARQILRYLRNTLMAKLGGEKTELLQISADERARAARTAQLFTEEEITRNLQIMLNTFDALNETQEHRFHLELGLLKLVHAQRLLPIEQLLSSVASGVPVRGAPQTSGSRMAMGTSAPPARVSPPPERAVPSQAAAVSPSPLGSGFGSGGSAWNPGPALKQSAPIASVAELELKTEPAPQASVAAAMEAALSQAALAPPGAPVELAEADESEVEPLRKPATVPQITAAPSIETLRLAVISALADGGHATAAQILGAGSWSVDGSSLRIEVAGIGKKMLSLTVNPAAEKIIRQELQRLGGPARFLIVPVEGAIAAAGAAAAAAPVAPAGSIQETALANPLVQRAKEIFKAEVRSVVDLRAR
jgi:DNA polymerase-3 subunit gamma/tau